MTTFFYRAFGLTIASTLVLPELLEAAPSPSADLTIHVGIVDKRPPADAATDRCYFLNAREACIFSQDAGLFSMRDGRTMVVEPAPEVDARTMRLYILGAGLGMILHQRGMFLLHGSAVRIRVGDGGGVAVAFVGDCGAGKSTMAGSLVELGHSLIADDLVAIEWGESGPRVRPGFPVLRLCPDAAEALGHAPHTLPLMRPGEEKRLRWADGDFAEMAEAEGVPLARIYVLEVGARLEVSPLEPQEAFLGLLKNSYTARVLRKTDAAPLHLKRCGQLAGSGAVVRLARPRDLAGLRAVAKRVVEDATSTVGGVT